MSYLREDFPGTRNYDSDLGFLIEKYIKLGNDYETLVQIYEYIKKDIKDITIEQLQKWLDDGTLETVILAAFQKTVQIYATTESMLTDDTITSGMYIQTLARSTNGGAGACFEITDNTENGDLYLTLNNGLFAHYANKDVYLSALITDHGSLSDQLIEAILKHISDNHSTLYVDCNATITANQSLFVKSNSTIIGSDQTKIYINSPFEEQYYQLIYLDNVSNISIKNLRVDGSKQLNTASSGEWGYCIRLDESHDIDIINCELFNAFGDGICIDTNQTTVCYNINIENCSIHNNRRQGISILGGYNIVIENCEIYDISGTAPQDGILIEPYKQIDIKTINISNCVIKNCSGTGIRFYGKYLTNENQLLLSVTNCFITSCYAGVGSMKTLAGNPSISFNNIHIENCQKGIEIMDHYKGMSFFNNFTLIDCFSSGASNVPIFIDNQQNNEINNVYFNNIKVIYSDDSPAYSCVINTQNINKLVLNEINFEKIKNIIHVKDLTISNRIIQDFSSENPQSYPPTNYYYDLCKNNATNSTTNIDSSNLIKSAIYKLMFTGSGVHTFNIDGSKITKNGFCCLLIQNISGKWFYLFN